MDAPASHGEPFPIMTLKARVYDILANRAKLQPPDKLVGALDGPDSALFAFLAIAIDKAKQEMVVETLNTAMEGIGLTLLAIYEHGVPYQAAFENSGSLRRVAEILYKAGEDARPREADESDGATEAGRTGGLHDPDPPPDSQE